MKTTSKLVLAGVYALIASSGWAASETAKSEPLAQPAAVAPGKTSPPAVKAVPRAEVEKRSPDVSRMESPGGHKEELSASKAREEANRKHIRPATELVTMETPPPEPRIEKKPPAPTAGLVWKPGHWTPVKSEWQWTPGEWGIPATPISVWIEPNYDAKTKKWTPGYWQPDRDVPYEPEAAHEEQPVPTEKFL